MTRRIQKKRSLRRDVEELRDYVTGKNRKYPMWRLLRLQEWGPTSRQNLSRSKAKRMLRERDRHEIAQMRDMILSLTKDTGEMKNCPSEPLSPEQSENQSSYFETGYRLLSSYR